ncbi:Basic helix-loop-helix DNA-binding superfamily protein, putative [Theobroma cacao]|uniref:Basic helix-loop-helix DNA-binding superfamily protein, putative n=1 Tax=Theobroma cacao TaxID=3641 RepID=A0A061GN23_THECC|nr:Basic helix-loop-helix DNA-binding superfamily protein, putative [Theobroma cacao]
MEFGGSGMSDRGPRRGRMGRRRLEDDEDDQEFISKNLHAERRRRQKLSDRLLTLRSSMNKATIIEDAITYIQELQKSSQVLTEQLLEMEGSSEEGGKPMADEIDAAEDMKNYGIKEDVNVTNIDGNKLLIRIILEKRRGCFTKLIEAMNYLGFELCETNVTTCKGAMLFSSCVQELKVLPCFLSFMARIHHLCIVLAAGFFSFIVMFQATDGSRLTPPEAGIDADPPDVKMIAEGPVIRAIGKHSSLDKSAAGGDVILGGFVMAVVVAVVCYLRITRKSQEAYS